MHEGWNKLGSVGPRELAGARLQQHYAAQIASALGRTLVPKRDDDSHTNLGWVDRLGAFASHPTPADRPLRAAVELEVLRLLLLGDEDRVIDETPLAGRTMADAEAWLAGRVAEQTGDARPTFVPVHYELPEHPLASGAAFALEPAASAELACWYANAASVLEAVREEYSSGPVRCWPHHFDIATLIELGEDCTIGVGLSPGDDSYVEPYWYVAPWPHPKPDAWPRLDGGRWRTEGFVAAVLTGSELVAAADRPAALRAFLRSAIRASRALLDNR